MVAACQEGMLLCLSVFRGNDERMILLPGLVLGPPRIIGLDVGTTAIKAARIRRTGDRFDVIGLARAVIEGQPSAGNRQQHVVAAIRNCLRDLGGKDGVVCGLSGPDVAVRTFDLPPLPKKQLTSAVELEAAQVCSFDIQEGAVAFQVLRGTPKKTPTKTPSRSPSVGADKNGRLAGILAAAKKDVVAHLRELCRQSEVTCVMMDVDGLALLNCLEASRICPPGETAVVLNVGSAYVNVALLSDDGLPFVQDIAYAGQEILDHLCESTGMDRKAAGALLEPEDKDSASESLLSGLRKACAPLAERVKETLRYHVARKSGPEVNKVLVCGGYAQPALVKALGSLLERQVERWNPLATLPRASTVPTKDSAQHGPQFAVALGLAMRSVRDVQD